MSVKKKKINTGAATTEQTAPNSAKSRRKRTYEAFKH